MSQSATLEKAQSPAAAVAHDNGEPTWLADRRAQAWEHYLATALPGQDEEDWRRTSLRGLDLSLFEGRPGRAVDARAARAATASGDFVGHSLQVDSTVIERTLADDLARQGVLFVDLHTAAREHADVLRRYFMADDGVNPRADKFMALHSALAAGGNLIYVPAGVQVERAVKCTYWLDSPSAGFFPHTLIVLEQDARLVVLDEYLSATSQQPALAVPVTEAFLGPFARLNYVSLQRWGQNTWNISRQRFVSEEGSQASLLFAALGSKLTKAYVDTIFRGPSSSASLRGLIVGDNDQHIDYQTLQEHSGVASESDLDFRAALRGSSRAIWLGLCAILKDAQRSNANQTCRNLLLSEKASAFPIPSLEILANDVKCSHGTTVGQVDESQVFYAMTRGIDRETAQKMIVDGFLEPLIDTVPTEGVRDLLHEILDQRLEV